MSGQNTNEEKILGDLLKMQPNRAVDRLLSENSVHTVFNVYGSLQDKIKKNTTDLRQALSSKYDNLLDCTDILSQISKFSCEIKEIQQGISSLISADPGREDVMRHQGNIIKRIERELAKGRYLEAMRMCDQCDQCDKEDLLYCRYLRVEILDVVEELLISRKFTGAFIREVVECMRVYIGSVGDWGKMGKIGRSMLGYIVEAVLEKGTGLGDGYLIEIIFKCKLLSLSKAITTPADVPADTTQVQRRLMKFFHDIYQLMSEDHDLCAIFTRSLKQIRGSISEIFIRKVGEGVLHFQHELYKRMINCPQFIGILRKIEELTQQDLYSFFVGLWQEYYHVLIDLLVKSCMPVRYLGEVEKGRDGDIPKEFLKYITDRSASSSLKVLNNYRKTLKSCFENMVELLKCRKGERVADVFNVRIGAIEREVEEQFMEEESSKLGLRKAVLLAFMCCEYGEIVETLQCRPLLKQTIACSVDKFMRFHTAFDCSSVEAYMKDLDGFFMSYTPDKYTVRKINALKSIILAVLRGLMRASDEEKAQKYFSKKDEEIDEIAEDNEIVEVEVQLRADAFVKRKGVL